VFLKRAAIARNDIIIASEATLRSKAIEIGQAFEAADVRHA
jgi:hypothetical protein